MDPVLGGALMIGAMLVVVAFGIPVGIAMAGVGFLGMWALAGLKFAMGTFMTLPYSVSSQYAFVVVPMFVLMGALAARAGITGELYEAANRLLSRFRGSLYYATILASAAFGAISGSTVVASAVFTKIALPEMIRYGYSRSISAGCIAGAGTFAALIPPSISMAIYGILTGESIGALLMAGVVPGILTAVCYMLGMRMMLQFRPDWAPQRAKPFTGREILDSLRGLWAVIALVVLVLGGIYSGMMPPSAAGTIGAAGALLICLIRRKLSREEFWSALKQAAVVSSVLFLIIIGGLLFTRLLLYMGFVRGITGFADGIGLTPFMLLFFVIAMYLVLGCFIDTVSMMVMTVPFLYPIVKQLGLDPIWFGVIIVKLVEISAITPPVGLNLYSVIGAAEGRVKTGEVFAGVLPFILIECIVLAALLMMPELSLWLPQAMLD